jgi:hypothetical protein
MADLLPFWLYLFALLALPILAQWRWGVLAALAGTFMELLAVPLVFYVLDVNHMIAVDRSGLPDHPLARIREQQARGMAVALVWTMIPGAAVLLGGGIAVVWAAAAAGWRALSRTRGEMGKG